MNNADAWLDYTAYKRLTPLAAGWMAKAISQKNEKMTIALVCSDLLVYNDLDRVTVQKQRFNWFFPRNPRPAVHPDRETVLPFGFWTITAHRWPYIYKKLINLVNYIVRNIKHFLNVCLYDKQKGGLLSLAGIMLPTGNGDCFGPLCDILLAVGAGRRPYFNPEGATCFSREAIFDKIAHCSMIFSNIRYLIEAREKYRHPLAQH
jgi:hypothetical protein